MAAPTLELLTDLMKKAKKAGASEADAMLLGNEHLVCRQRMGKPETLERAESRDLGLRVLVKGKKGTRQAIVSSNDFSKKALSELLERAVAMAKAAPEDPFAGLADSALLAQKIPALDLADKSLPDEKALKQMAARVEEAALAVKHVTNSEGADASAARTEVFLATTQGFAGHYAATSYAMAASIIAGTGTQMETDFEYTLARHLKDLKSPEEVGRRAATRAVGRLHSKKAKTCQVPVMFEPRVARGLLHSFAGAINGAAVARGTSFLKDRMGKPVFKKGVSIIDDPLRKRGVASHPFDGEGVAARKLAVVKGGMLQSWLLDSRSARQLGMKSTGHASRSASSPPRPSSSNFYMEAGKESPESLMSDIKDGFYVTEAFGMGVNDVTGDYSQGASGFWIRNGKLAHAVSGVTIAGNMKDMFLNLEPASDLELSYATSAPTLRIEGMTVAGSDQ